MVRNNIENERITAIFLEKNYLHHWEGITYIKTNRINNKITCRNELIRACC